MKLSKLSIETTPASFPLSASFMAASVKALEMSFDCTFLEILIISCFNDYGNICHQIGIQ